MKTIWWIRQDLRLADNPALLWAAAHGEVIPLYILQDSADGRALGGASQWWLHHSLAALGARIPLVLRRGAAADIIPALIADTGASAVVWNRCYEPWAIKRDSSLKALLREAGLQAETFNSALLIEPWDIRNKEGQGYKVFTPFWKFALTKIEVTAPVQADPVWVQKIESLKLDALKLLPTAPDWSGGFAQVWRPGEAGANARLQDFISHGLKGYGAGRDRPDLGHVSGLSAPLHWGEISVREVWRRVHQAVKKDPDLREDAAKFLSELGWREFAHHLLYDYPTLPHQNWKAGFDAYPWRENPQHLQAWQQGRTGYPFVDAGMRQLWATGWMHNRVRMITASFLVKHLRLDWRLGEAWFWDTLADADCANNASGWQWVAGCGADAAPYFRIFNPTEQARKFDPAGDYIRRWCPELAQLPNAFLFTPWEAPDTVLRAAGVRLDETYPRPIVEHNQARHAALKGYEMVKAANAD